MECVEIGASCCHVVSSNQGRSDFVLVVDAVDIVEMRTYRGFESSQGTIILMYIHFGQNVH